MRKLEGKLRFARVSAQPSLGKLAGKLRFAVAERKQGIAWNPLYSCLAVKGGRLPIQVLGSLRWWSRPWVLDRAPPFRMYSGATGAGAVASFTFIDNRVPPC